MKLTILIFMVLFHFSLPAQVTIDNTGRGGTRSVTRTVENNRKIEVKELNVLFLGNELSAANSMHQVFQYIGSQLPKPYKITSASVFGKGFSFEEHNQRTNLSKFYEKYK